MPPNNETPATQPNKGDEWIAREAHGDPELIELIRQREAFYKAPNPGITEWGEGGIRRKQLDLMVSLTGRIEARKAQLHEGENGET